MKKLLLVIIIISAFAFLMQCTTETVVETKAVEEGNPHFDDFEKDRGWIKYLDGEYEIVELDGNSVFHKTANKPPSGAYRFLNEKISDEFSIILETRRDSLDGDMGHSNRYALLDSQLNGYGFRVTYTPMYSAIELEKMTNGSRDSQRMAWIDLAFLIELNKWYTVEFHYDRGVLQCAIYDENGQLGFVKDWDFAYDGITYDRILIHGGAPYYTDDIQIIDYKE